MAELWVKVCGVTLVEDVHLLIEAGASAVGLNLWPQSPRHVTLEAACALAEVARGKLHVVAVTVDLSLAQLRAVQAELKPDLLQLHGDEPDELVTMLAPHAYRAIGLGSQADVHRALNVPGPYVLIDARDDVQRGGTGVAPPASLAQAVCAGRPTILAGGLGPDNVEAAVRAFGPRGVDAASRLESAPGRKDRQKVSAFVAAAKAGAVQGAVHV